MRVALLPIGLILAGCSGTGSGDDTVIPARDGGPETVRDGGVEGGACESWLVEYHLDNSQFEVREVIGGTRTNDIGPGRILLRYPDENGVRALGPVTVVDYMLTIDFEESGIVTDIDTYAGPNDCGLARGVATSTTITWDGPIDDHHSSGTVTCNGEEIVCAFAMLPRGEPQRRDSEGTLPVSSFTIDANGALDSGFFEISTGQDVGRTFQRLAGAERSSVCVPLPTNCP